MGAFEYTAVDQRGRRKKGVIEGDTARSVRQGLRDMGLVPMEVEATAAKRKSSGSSLSFKRGISTTDLSLLTRQLATLLKAGLPLEECLKAVSEQSESGRVKSLLLAVRSKVKEGHPLATGMADYPKVFPEMYRSSVRAGEESGHLDGVLEGLADYVEVTQERQGKIRAAMIYPIFLTIVSLSVVLFLIYAVVPDMVQVYRNNGSELPYLTQQLIAVSDFMQAHWLVLLLVTMGSLISLVLLFQRPGPKFCQAADIPGKARRGVEHGIGAGLLSVVPDHRRVRAGVADQVVADDHDGDAGGADVLLRASVDDAVVGYVDRTRQDAGGKIRHQRDIAGGWRVLELDAFDGFVGSDVHKGRVAVQRPAGRLGDSVEGLGLGRLVGVGQVLGTLLDGLFAP